MWRKKLLLQKYIRISYIYNLLYLGYNFLFLKLSSHLICEKLISQNMDKHLSKDSSQLYFLLIHESKI